MPVLAPLALVVAAATVVAPAERPASAPVEVGDQGAPAAAGASPLLPTSDPKSAQSRLRGRVFALGSRDAIAGARVIAQGGPEVTTDEDGAFELWLVPGTHTVILRADGYEDLRVQVDIAARDDLEYEYRLAGDRSGNRFRTVVRQEREVAVSKTTLSGDEIHAAPGTFGDPFRVIQSLPGASQVAGFLPYVVVRGAAPGNTGYYLDGVRVPILFHVAVGPSVVHPYFIDAVDFYPGGAPVRLGRYTSGIIEGRTRAAHRDRARGDFEVRLTDAGGIVEVPIDRRRKPGCKEEDRRKCPRGQARGSLTLAGRYSYTAAVLSLVQSTARIAFWDYQARLDHRLGPRSNYTLFAFGSKDELGEKAAPEPFLRFEFHRVVQRVRTRLPGDGVVDSSLALGLDRSGITSARVNEWRVAPRVDVRVPVRGAKNASFGFGIDQEFQIFRAALAEDDPGSVGDGTIDATATFLSDRTVSATGIYADLLWHKGQVEIRPGVRADVYIQNGRSAVLAGARSVTHAWGIDPRILLRETLSPRWTLRQNVGVYHQPPTTPVPIPGFESFGFEFGLQRGVQGSAGYELNLGKSLVLTQDAYVSRLTNLQDYDIAAALAEPTMELEDLVTQVNGWAYGLETMLRLTPQTRLFGWAAYTLSRSTRDFPIGGSAPSNWDQRHILNIVLGYRLGPKWSFGGRVHFHTGRPYTAQIGMQSYAEALAQNRNNRRLQPFFQLDLRVERSWNFRTWTLQAVLDVINSTYGREVLACTPASDGETSTSIFGLPGCDAQALRYILPSIGLRGIF